jgi:hypothetical protein
VCSAKRAAARTYTAWWSGAWRCSRARPTGQALQVDPFKPTLKAPEATRLPQRGDEPLSSFGLKSNLCRYPLVHERPAQRHQHHADQGTALHSSTSHLNLCRSRHSNHPNSAHIRPKRGRLCTAVFCAIQCFTLVHFSAQPEPMFASFEATSGVHFSSNMRRISNVSSQYSPQNLMKQHRKVDACRQQIVVTLS